MPLDQSFVGRTYPPTEPYVVGREKIREFARAIGATDPEYHDPAAAGTEPWGTSSARLAVHGVPAVARAELLQLQAVGVVAAVLTGDVIPLLALRTRQGDLRTDVGRLGHGGVPSC